MNDDDLQQRAGRMHLEAKGIGDTIDSIHADTGRVRELAPRSGAATCHSTIRDLWWIQDVHVTCRRPASAIAHWTGTRDPRGRIDHAKINLDGQTWIGGWVVVRQGFAPIRSVRILTLGPGALAIEE